MPKETEIYIIRHGSVDNPQDIVYGRLSIPLSAKGREEVEQLSTELVARGVKFNKIYSSPVARAVETSQIICQKLGLDGFETRDELSDTDVGELEGKSMQILRDAEYEEVRLKEMGYVIESREAIIDRAGKLIDELKVGSAGEVVGLVSHGDITRLAIWSQENSGEAPPETLRDAEYLATAEAAILRFTGKDYLSCEFVRRESIGEGMDHIKRTEAY